MVRPYLSLVNYATSGSSTKRAVLLFEDDFTSGNYSDGDKPFGWFIDMRSGAEDADDYFRIETSPKWGATQQLEWESSVDIIETLFNFHSPVFNQLVIELENFYYDDVGSADRFFIQIRVIAWDNSAAAYVPRDVAALKYEHNVLYYLTNGVYTNTGLGNPDTWGRHTIKLFINFNTNLGNRVRYRYEISGGATGSGTGTMQNIFDDDNDALFMQAGIQLAISPTLSAGWDIDAGLYKVRIYWRDNSDI